MSRRRYIPRRRQFAGPRTNERIRVPEIRVIGADGSMLGVLDTRDAKRMAREAGLDLVEVNPKAHPPVCKIMDYGKYKYEEKKKKSEARKRQVQVELKEIKMRPKTDDHDMEVKVKHTRRFLEGGNKVKITCRFRGREITHPETARTQLEYVMSQVEDLGILEIAPRMEGRTMISIIAPRPEIRARVTAEANARSKASRRKREEGEEGDDDQDLDLENDFDFEGEYEDEYEDDEG